MAVDGVMFDSSKLSTSTAITGKGADQMDMNDFLNLLVAQMTNQDMMNPTNDTEFVAQMAQFSSLQGINTLQEYALSSYASSYAGKYVTIANQTAGGGLETITGQVEAVTFYDGSPKVVVNGKTYDLHTVMEVSDTANGGTLHDATQYVGKKVTVSYKDELGEEKKHIGKVTGVTIKDNAPHVIIDGKEYPVTSIVDVEVDDTVEDEPEDGSETEAVSAAAARAMAPESYQTTYAANTVPPEERIEEIDRTGSEDWLIGKNTQYYAKADLQNYQAQQGYASNTRLGTVKEINDMDDGESTQDWLTRQAIIEQYTTSDGYASNTRLGRVREINDMDDSSASRSSSREDYGFIDRSYDRNAGIPGASGPAIDSYIPESDVIGPVMESYSANTGNTWNSGGIPLSDRDRSSLQSTGSTSAPSGPAISAPTPSNDASNTTLGRVQEINDM